MAKVSRIKIIKSLIDDGRLLAFAEIFDYATKAEIAKAMGINYTRLLNLIKNPKKLKYEESISIAKILGVTGRQISDLVHNQIEGKGK